MMAVTCSRVTRQNCGGQRRQGVGEDVFDRVHMGRKDA